MKVNCDVVRDLLPLYVEEMLSEESQQIVEEHLCDCEQCQKILAEMKTPEIQIIHSIEPIKKFKQNVRMHNIIITAISTFNIALVLGLLLYSIIFIVINKKFNPLEIRAEEIHLRFLWRKIAENIVSICSLVYSLGHFIMLYLYVKKHWKIEFRKIGGYFISQIILMFGCTVPFAMFDVAYFGDYLFPIWGLIGNLLLMLIIVIINLLYQKIKKID